MVRSRAANLWHFDEARQGAFRAFDVLVAPRWVRRQSKAAAFPTLRHQKRRLLERQADGLRQRILLADMFNVARA